MDEYGFRITAQSDHRDAPSVPTVLHTDAQNFACTFDTMLITLSRSRITSRRNKDFFDGFAKCTWSCKMTMNFKLVVQTSRFLSLEKYIASFQYRQQSLLVQYSIINNCNYNVVLFDWNQNKRDRFWGHLFLDIKFWALFPNNNIKLNNELFGNTNTLYHK